MNGGFLEIMSLNFNKTSLNKINFSKENGLKFDCIIMHDVDLVT